MFGALTFIAVLSVLVVVHEYGHYIAARMVGIKVEKFSIGFGPVIAGKKIGDTEFVFSLLPLGGYVKMAGESPDDAKGEAWEFNSKNLWQKFIVVFAGPVMNAFLAFVIFAGIYMVGQPTTEALIGKVLENSAAQKAGLLENDKILSINGQKTVYWEDVLAEVRKPQKVDVLQIERSGKVMDVQVEPEIRSHKDIFGKVHESAFVGIAPSSKIIYVKNSFVDSLAMAFERLWLMTGMIFYSLGMVVTGAVAFKDSMTGPIGIYFMTQQAAGLGFIYLLNFMASLSVSLFVLNLLPIPVLDGGHVLFIIIEKLKGSPLKDSVKEKMTQVGMIALLALMVFVILQDIHRFSVIENIRKFIFKS